MVGIWGGVFCAALERGIPPAVCPVWMAPTVAVAMGDTSFGPMMSSAVSRPRDPVVVFVTLACGTTAGLVCTAVVLAGGACLTIIGSTGPKEPWGTAADLVTLVCGIAVGLARGVSAVAGATGVTSFDVMMPVEGGTWGSLLEGFLGGGAALRRALGIVAGVLVVVVVLVDALVALTAWR